MGFDGTQWTPDEIAAFKEQPRPPLVLNRVEKSYSEMHDDLTKEVCAALCDEELTVGAAVGWRFGALITGNLPKDGPALSPVLVDDYGRLWKERHCDDANGRRVSSLVCILDLRRII